MTTADEIRHLGTVNVHEAKTHLSRLLERVKHGEEIVIAKAGKPIAKLVPIEAAGKRPLGLYKGQIWMSDDFDEPLPWQIFPGFPLE
ncbi:MAG: type II toxin-antitoxin system Phd/YefM family antitoxin [Actinobacteria bacterium]|nr:type II toxin-antitoxin system Phd/YefM family antitoxin [Actinomycetota bacterium]